jgi:hypothetical protein
MMVYPTAELARRKTRDDSPWFRSLNGVWKFQYSASPAARPTGFERPWFDDTPWADVRVPGNWELQGFGMPIYSNSRYPFAYDPRNPRAQRNDNPVGSYRTVFEIPADWAGRRVLLHFGGVDSAFYVWVNGARVGYNEDSRTPAEFDVTAHVRKGPNLLAVEVYRWSDGSYLEDQDMFRLSGIFATVPLSTAEPRPRLRAPTSTSPPRCVLNTTVTFEPDADCRDIVTLQPRCRGLEVAAVTEPLARGGAGAWRSRFPCGRRGDGRPNPYLYTAHYAQSSGKVSVILTRIPTVYPRGRPS